MGIATDRAANLDVIDARGTDLALQFLEGPPFFLLIHGDTGQIVFLEQDQLLGARRITVPLLEGRYDVIGLFTPTNPGPRPRPTIPPPIPVPATPAEPTRFRR